jgi:cytochrome c5
VRSLPLLVATAALSLTACTSRDPAAQAADPVQAATRTETADDPAWAGKKLTVYRNSYRICHVFTAKELGRWYGVEPRVKVVADTHAREMYLSRHSKPARAGCLTAFREKRERSRGG